MLSVKFKKISEIKKPLNNELFSEMKQYIQLNAKLKDQASCISSWFRGSRVKFASIGEKRGTNTYSN
jgi:hypothetical protein